MVQSYIWPLQDSLKPGQLIRIRGCIQKEGKRFDVNFQNEFEYNKSDLILHTSLRYSDGAGFLVNNSKNENGWMDEIMHRNISFEPGVDFEILVLCDYDKYQLALDGNHISDYRHRLPYSEVKCLGIRGDVVLNLISMEDNNDPEIDLTATNYRNPLSLTILPKKKLKKVVRCKTS